MEKKTLSPILKHDTYIYVDTSNIRSACIKTLGFKIDFDRMIEYFKKKYPRLKEVRYYEGISNGDMDKEKAFKRLEKAGYTICSLSRKAYENPAVYKSVRCRKCGNTWKTQLQKKSLSLKSNVDVYLSTEFLEQAYFASRPTHLILVSCDGDYAEMVKAALRKNKNVLVTVLGTPVVKDRTNTFSVRLQRLNGKIPQFTTNNIQTIRNLIEELPARTAP